MIAKNTRTIRTLSILLIAVGVILLVIGPVNSLVMLVADNTPPRIISMVPTSGGVYVTLNTASMTAEDLESGLKLFNVKIYDTFGTLLFEGSYTIPSTWGAPITSTSKSWAVLPVMTTIGGYRAVFTAENMVGLSSTVTVTFRIYTALQGMWYVTNIQITSTEQVIATTTLTIPFKFVKTAGVDDSLITCTVWEGTTQLFALTNSAMSTWTGSYTFANGRHTLDLKASDGTETVTMSVIGLQVGSGGFETSMQMIMWLAGVVFIVAGIGLYRLSPQKPSSNRLARRRS